MPLAPRFFCNKFPFALTLLAAVGFAAFDAHAQASTDRNATSAWKTAFGPLQYPQCRDTAAGQSKLEPLDAAPVQPADAESGYYCGPAPPSQWVPIQNVSASMRSYRQAAAVNPYSAIALFSARTELSSETEPNRTSLSLGAMVVLTKSYSEADVIRGIQADLDGRPLEAVGAPLPPGSFIVVVSERAHELDNPLTGDAGGFRLTPYMENADGDRTALGKSALVLVDAPRKLQVDTGQSLEIFDVTEVVPARSR